MFIVTIEWGQKLLHAKIKTADRQDWYIYVQVQFAFLFDSDLKKSPSPCFNQYKVIHCDSGLLGVLTSIEILKGTFPDKSIYPDQY